MKRKHVYPIAFFAFALLLSGPSFGQSGVSLRPKVYLQGALHGLSPAATLMRDDLRSKGLIPLTEPYTGLINFHHKGGGGGEAIADPSILQATGPDAIVDWVVVELRTSFDAPNTAIATKSALLQRDGDVVAVDGVSPVAFPQVAEGQYFVAIRHRNLLGVVTREQMSLSEAPKDVDFTDDSIEVCPYSNPLFGGRGIMIAGDCGRDGRVIFQGPQNDRTKVFMDIMTATGNEFLTANFIHSGYSIYDLNMDGKVIYQGPNSEASLLFKTALTAPHNVSAIPNYIVTDCLPN